MKKKRARRISLALLGMFIVAGLFYFLLEKNPWPWIGVPEHQPFGSYAEQAKAPGSGPAAVEPKAVELVAVENDSAIHGEVTMGMSFATSDSPDAKEPRHVDVDPAVLDEIGDTLLKTFEPVRDALLGATKLPDLKTPAVAPEPARKIVDRITAAQPTNISVGDVDLAESRLQNLLRQTQTSRDMSILNDASALRGGVPASAQLGSSSMGASGANVLSGPTGTAKSALSSLPRH